MMHDWGFGWGWGGGMFFGPFFMIALLVLSVVLIVALVRRLNGGRDTPGVRLPRHPVKFLTSASPKAKSTVKTTKDAPVLHALDRDQGWLCLRKPHCLHRLLAPAAYVIGAAVSADPLLRATQRNGYLQLAASGAWTAPHAAHSNC